MVIDVCASARPLGEALALMFVVMRTEWLLNSSQKLSDLARLFNVKDEIILGLDKIRSLGAQLQNFLKSEWKGVERKSGCSKEASL